MALQFSPTVPEDLKAVSALMLTAFTAEPGASFLDQELLHWKYFEPGPPWEGSRGYVLKTGESIVAHCGIWPMNLLFRDQTISCICFVDWVSDRNAPGVGFLLKKKLMKLADTSIVVGGTEDTRAVVPKMGFEPVGEVGFFARVVRPWKQFRTRPSEGIGRDAARLVRNTAWSRTGTATAIPQDWSAFRLESFGELNLDGMRDGESPTPWRGADYLNYWLRTPSVTMSAFALTNRGNVCGYFLLSRVGHQTRIADLRLSSSKQDEWNVAYALAAKRAAEDPETCEIVAVASNSVAEVALRLNSFRQRERAPFFLYDPQKKLGGSAPIFWNLIDGDAAYIQDAAHPYST
jgi:hypothetical protein